MGEVCTFSLLLMFEMIVPNKLKRNFKSIFSCIYSGQYEFSISPRFCEVSEVINNFFVVVACVEIKSIPNIAKNNKTTESEFF